MRVGWPLEGPFGGCGIKQTGLEFLALARLLPGGGSGLLGQKDGLDVGQNAALGDGHAGEEFVQFLVVADGQLEMTGNDPGLLVVTGSVSCQLENLSGQVLHDGGQVDGGSSANSLGVVSFAEKTMDTTDWELKPGTRAASLALSLRLSSLSAS